MLQIEEVNYFRRNVTVNQPDPDRPSVTRPQSFVARFKIPDFDRLEDITRRNSGEGESDLTRIRECLDEVLVGAEGVGDKGSKEPYPDAEAVALVKRVSHVAIATHQEFWKALNDMGGVRRKN